MPVFVDNVLFAWHYVNLDILVICSTLETCNVVPEPLAICMARPVRCHKLLDLEDFLRHVNGDKLIDDS